MVQLNAHGEVADFQDTSQFAPNESEFACGEFAGAIVKFAGYPGKGAAWQQLYGLGKKPGPSLSPEYGSVTREGKPIRVQEFAHTRCEWDGQPHWYPQL